MSKKAVFGIALGSIIVFMVVYLNRAEIPIAQEASQTISHYSAEAVGYLKNPMSLLAQFQQHAMGYTAIGSFTGGAVLAVAKWIGGRATQKIQHIADAKIEEVTGQLTSKTGEVDILNSKLGKRDELIGLYEQRVTELKNENQSLSENREQELKDVEDGWQRQLKQARAERDDYKSKYEGILDKLTGKPRVP